MSSEKQYPLCMDTGQMVSFNRKTKIANVMKDIGLGASIYLYMLKQLIHLFLFLTIINIPIILVFYSGDERNHKDFHSISSHL